MNLIDEKALLARAQSGPEGFGELFDLCYDRIYAYAYRRVGTRDAADDIAACTFEDALRGIKRLEWQDKPIIAWLYRIAARRVVDHYRRNRAHSSAGWLATGAVDDDKDALEQVERHAAIRAALTRLAPADREIIRLTYFDELETAETAAILNCNANTVYVRLHRALKRLRVILEEEPQDEKALIHLG